MPRLVKYGLSLLLLAGCGTGGSSKQGPAGGSGTMHDDPMNLPMEMPPVPEPTEVTTSVTTSGGIVTLGQLKLTFPKNAIDSTISVTLRKTDATADGYMMFSSMYVFEPEGLLLNSRIILEIPFEADGATAKLYWSRANDPTQYDEIEGVVVGTILAVEIDHLGHGFVGQLIPVMMTLTPPEAPSGVIAHAGDTEVDVTWPAVANASSYKVVGSLTTGGPYSSLATVTTAKYTHVGLENATPYYYVVRASNADGDSAPSEEATATPAPIEEPSAVTAVGSNGSINISWTPPEHASTHASYVVYRVGPTGPTSPTALVSTSGVQVTDTQVSNGFIYNYFVQALGPAPSGATSPLSAPGNTFPFALAPTGSFVSMTGASCTTGLSGVPSTTGVVGSTGCSPCAYSVRWSAADAQATKYSVSVKMGGGDPKPSAVAPVSEPKDAFLCRFGYRPDLNETNQATVSVSTCYGPSGTLCTASAAEYSFSAFDDVMNDTCLAPSGVTFTCPYP